MSWDIAACMYVCVCVCVCVCMYKNRYRGADKSLVLPGRKQANASVRTA